MDRESAYEILGKKVEAIKKEETEEAAKKEWEKGRGGDWGRRTSRTSGRTTTRRRTGVSPVVKVLTSATFIRGVMGILKRVI
jgi:hypothetical protein